MFSYSLNQHFFPKLLKNLLSAIIFISLLGALLHRIPIPFTSVNLQSLLALSSWGISKWMIWQFVTYLFIQPIGEAVNISFFINLFFNLLIIFYVGKSICDIKGSKHLLWLFLGGGIISALATSTILYMLGLPFYFASCHNTIYCLLAAWMFIYPNKELLFFLMFPVKVKWIVCISAITTLFIDLCNGQFVNFFLLFFNILFGYFYALLVFEITSPFPRLYQFDKKILNCKHWLLGSKWDSIERYIHPKKRKIYDFKTGKVVIDDETFMNVCLEKIHKYGKRSLSLSERFRMYRISKKMQKNKPVH